MAEIRQSTIRNRTFLMISSVDHITGAAGLIPLPTVVISKNGAAFAPPVGTVSEIAYGWYVIALTVADTDTLNDLDYHASAIGADPTDWADQVIMNVISKNTAINNFSFPMYSSTTHELQTGLTVSATRAIDGNPFAPCANSPAEIGASGIYAINLAASDLNGNVIMLLFQATGADDNPITLLTQ